MTEETAAYMAAPIASGERPLPRRVGTRGLLPSTWLNRTLRVEYTDAAGRGATTSGTLADWTPVGPVLLVAGARTILAWECLRLIELVED